MTWTYSSGDLTSLDFTGFGLFSPKVSTRLSEDERETLVVTVNDHAYSTSYESEAATQLFRRDSDGYEVVALTPDVATELGFTDRDAIGLRHFWLVEPHESLS